MTDLKMVIDVLNTVYIEGFGIRRQHIRSIIEFARLTSKQYLVQRAKNRLDDDY